MMQLEPTSSPVPVLVLEDNPAFLRLLREGLTYAGYDVSAAPTGKEGLQLLRTHPAKPQLILCDFHLADMTACTFLQAAIDDKLLSTIPVVLFSGNTSSKCLCPNFETRIEAQLIKPFTLDTLIDTVETVLAARRASH